MHCNPKLGIRYSDCFVPRCTLQLLIIIPTLVHSVQVQALWVSCVLPMTCDDESSVVSKTAEAVFQLIVDPMVQWCLLVDTTSKAYDAQALAETLADSTRTYELLLPFNLCRRISEANLANFLRSSVTSMIKQGILKSYGKSKGNRKYVRTSLLLLFLTFFLLFSSRVLTYYAAVKLSSSILHVIEVLRFACAYGCDSSTAMKESSRLFDDMSITAESGCGSSSSVSAMKAYFDPVDIVLGAWVLLEGVVSQPGDVQLMCTMATTVAGAVSSSNTGTSTANGTMTTMVSLSSVIKHAGSADFAVQFFKEHFSGRRTDNSGAASSQTNTSIISTSMQAVSHGVHELVRVLKVIEKLACNLEMHSILFMQNELVGLLRTLGVSDFQLASACVSLMFELSKGKDEANGRSSVAESNHPSAAWLDVMQWSSTLVLEVHSRLRDLIFPRQQHQLLSLEDPAICNGLFLLGEISMLGFSIEEDERSMTKKQAALWVSGSVRGCSDLDGPIENMLGFQFGDSAKYFRLCIPHKTVDLLQLLLSFHLPACRASSSSDAAYGFNTVDVGVRPCPAKIRAMAFIAMGKLCLRDKALARKTINIFLRELSVVPAATDTSSTTSSMAAVRCNALLVLGDLCVRFTNLVDRHIDTMAMCLHDQDLNIKRNALLLFAQLIQQDYIKWRGNIIVFSFLCDSFE